MRCVNCVGHVGGTAVDYGSTILMSCNNWKCNKSLYRVGFSNQFKTYTDGAADWAV